MSGYGNNSSGPSGGGGGGNGNNGGTLTGMAAVEQVFHFLDGPADVLRSATACRRWRALACADSVWRAKFRREKLLEKARLFEVALPAVPSAPGGAAAAAVAVVKDEAAGVGLAFYARIFVLKGYRMRDESRNAAHNNPDHDGGIHTAVDAWYRDPAAAKARYGPIASWDTSEITDMHSLFRDKKNFNEDISRWNVSNVVTMAYMFHGATSFNGDLSCWDVGQVRDMFAMFDGATAFDRQLDGAWATSSASKYRMSGSASKYRMFDNSPGTIAGKTKDAEGTIE